MKLRLVFSTLLTLYIHTFAGESIHAQNSWIPTSLTSGGGALVSNTQGHIFVHGTLIHRSTDNGATWATRGSEITSAPPGQIGIASNGHIFISRYRSVWRSRDNGDTWEKVDTTMGDILSLASNAAGEIFAATTIRGVYKSTNDGDSWQRVTTINATAGIVIDGNGKLYAGMNTTVYSSTDDGVTWIQAGDVPGVRSLGVNSLGHVFTGTSSNGTFRSTDNGAHWVPIHYGSGLKLLSGFVFDLVGNVFAVGGSGVYRSTDNGDSWAPINRGLPAASPSLLWANSLFASGTTIGVFRRNEILPPLPLPPSNLSPQDSAVNVPITTLLSWNPSSALTSYFLQVALNQNFSQLIYTNGNVIGNSVQPASLTYMTTYYWRLYGTGPEGTSDWSDTLRFTTVLPPVTPPTLLSPSSNALDVFPNPLLVWRQVIPASMYAIQVATNPEFTSLVFENQSVADTAIRVPISEPGASYFWRVRTIRTDTTSEWSPPFRFTTTRIWLAQQSGTVATLRRVRFIDQNQGWVVGDSGVILHTSNGGISWLRQSSGTTQNLSGVSFLDANRGIATGAGVTLRTSNGGNSWSVVNSSGVADVVLITADTASGVRGWGYNEIWGTTNGGTTWNIQRPTPTYSTLATIFSLGSGRIWVGGGFQTQFGTWQYVLLSTDRGTTWTMINSSSSSIIASICFTDESNGWGIAGGLILQTTNGGTSWLARAVTPIQLSSVSFANRQKGVFSGPWIFATSDGGNSWTTLEAGTSLLSAHFVDSEHCWVVGARGTILFSSTGGGVVSVDEKIDNKRPDSFLLCQNYPNPFNPTTKIEFRIASSGFVSLKVFDLLGREVATLVNEEMKPGSYERIFQAGGLASGVYLYRLQAGSFVQTKKLLLLR